LAATCSTSLQSQIDAAPSGSTLSLPACIYRETISINKPLTLDGAHQAEIRGSDVWTAWSNASPWTSQDAYPNVGNDSTAGTAPCDQGGPCYLDHFAAFNLEQVFRDGSPLVHVAASPGSGQFALDGSRHVVLGDSPSGHTIEVSTRKRWLNTNSSNVKLTNLTLRHAATGSFETAISSDLQTGFVVSNSLLSDAHGSMAGAGGEGAGNGAHYVSNTVVNAG